MSEKALGLMWTLRLPNGSRWGDVAADFQKEDAEAIFADEGPRWHYLTRPRGGSKPLALDTPLPTPWGWTTMGDVRRGDLLLDERGRPTTVLATGNVRTGELCYRVAIGAGEAIVASADHEWVVEDRQIRGNRGRDFLVTVTTTDLRERLRYGKRGDLRWGLPVAAPLDIPDARLPLAPYVFGAWLGDGHSDSSRLTVADVDASEVEALFENAGMPFVPSSSLRKEGAHCATRRFGNPLGTRSNGRGPSCYDAQLALRKLGVLRNKHIPMVYLRASYKQRLELLRGLMDTDGHQSHSMSIFNTTSKRLAGDVADLVVSLGWKANRQESRARVNGKDCGICYRVAFRSDTAPFNLVRKVARWSAPGKQAHRSANRTITAVEAVPSVPVRCIKVDSPSHLYLAGRSWVPTHNTTDLAAIALSWLMVDAPPLAQARVIASAKDQAEILIDAARSLINDTPALKGRVQIENERIISESAAYVKVMAMSDSASWGLRDTHLIVVDEFAQWPETRKSRVTWHAIYSTLPKPPQPKLVILTSAGEPSHFSNGVLTRPRRACPRSCGASPKSPARCLGSRKSSSRPNSRNSARPPTPAST